MEKAIRVLVANHPRLMREMMVTTFEDQPDIEVVGEVAEESDISETIRKTLPDFVVISLDHAGKRPHICDELLREHPQVRLIAVPMQNNNAVYYWASFNIHSNEVEASEEGILSAIRKRMATSEAN